MPLERDVKISINGPFWVEVANPEHPFMAMLISRSRVTCLIEQGIRKLVAFVPTDEDWSADAGVVLPRAARTNLQDALEQKDTVNTTQGCSILT